MIIILAVLATLPIVLEAFIEIHVRATNNTETAFAHFYGSVYTVANDDDLKAFLITNKKLYAGVKQYSKVEPDGVFLRSPTPWGDLYKKFDWEEVHVTVEPIHAKIVSLVPTKKRLYSHIFNNTHKKNNIFKARMRNQVLSTIFSTWERSEYTPNVTIYYLFEVDVEGVTDNYIFSYESRLNERVIKSKLLSVGLQSGEDYNIKPKKHVIAELYAIRWDMRIKIVYAAKLDGTVAINFAKPLDGHHFWAQDLNILLHKKKQGKKRYFIENIAFTYYTDPEIIVRDFPDT